MKQTIINQVIIIGLASLLAGDYIFHQEWAGNLAIFGFWFLIAAGFIALFTPPESLFKNSRKEIIKYERFCLVVALIFIGCSSPGLYS